MGTNSSKQEALPNNVNSSPAEAIKQDPINQDIKNHIDHMFDSSNLESAHVEIDYLNLEKTTIDLWPDSTVPYVFESIPVGLEALIQEAINEFHEKTSVKWVPLENVPASKHFVTFVHNTNAKETPYATPGRVEGGIISFPFPKWNSSMPLTKVCILHEMGHCIGLNHEHSRGDRNKYVDVVGVQSTSPDYKIFGTAFGAYDFDSIMHYEEIPGELHQKGYCIPKLSEKNTFSEGDIQVIEYLYGKNALCCTYEYFGDKFVWQDVYECQDCWGFDSEYGCCGPCAGNHHKGHNIRLIKLEENSLAFFCDCGRNKHTLKCSRHSNTSLTSPEVHLGEAYRCLDCLNKEEFCCKPCLKNCHKGHRVERAGIIKYNCKCSDKKKCKIFE